jgi:transcriptional regulator of acetoin/glycerol metabolism
VRAPQSRDAVAAQFDAVEVVLGPLRDRIDEIPALADRFAGHRRLSPEVTQLLTRLPWPGNVRELASVIARITDTPSAGPIKLSGIPPEITADAARRTLSRFERAEISALLSALADSNGNKTEAAKLAGVSRSTLYRKLRAGGIDLENTAF